MLRGVLFIWIELKYEYNSLINADILFTNLNDRRTDNPSTFDKKSSTKLRVTIKLSKIFQPTWKYLKGCMAIILRTISAAKIPVKTWRKNVYCYFIDEYEEVEPADKEQL